jgi:hypothetical protein
MRGATAVGVDVAVVGAGPAGISAAIRARYVKEFEALPLAVAVFEAGRPGGLLQAGAQRTLTGPSLKMEARTLFNSLLADLRRFEIPVIQERVRRIELLGDGTFLLDCGQGAAFSARSVVLATGSRPLGNELDHFGKGCFITYKGLSFIKPLLEEAAAVPGPGPVAVATNGKGEPLAELFRQASGPWLFLVPPGEEGGASSLPGLVVGCSDWLVRERRADGFLLETTRPDGRTAEHAARAILLDYLSFQGRPLLPDLGFPLERGDNDVPRIDAFLQTSQPGLFLAGDVTCRYASAAGALADGVAAGFGAYRHAYVRLFGREPPLFAYRAGDDIRPWLANELPELTAQTVLLWVQLPPPAHPRAAASGLSLAAAAKHAGIELEECRSLVLAGMREKKLTIRPPAGR